MVMYKKLFLFCSLIVLLSCNTQVSNQTVVYSNDFEKGDTTNLTGGKLGQFNGSKVLGQFSKGDFKLTVNNLPGHDLVMVTFDLYIHDNWRGELLPDGPAIWTMLIDNVPYINATFSNLDCISGNTCPPQSYPLNYPNNYNNPKAGAYRTDLPGVCSLQSSPNGTTQYKITKTFKDNNGVFTLECSDNLDQKDYANPLCEKSWSVDNIVVQTIKL